MYENENLIAKTTVRNKLDSIIDTEFHCVFDRLKQIDFPIDEQKERELLRIQAAYIQLNRIYKMIYSSFNFERR